jgi:hypothetical protein
MGCGQAMVCGACDDAASRHFTRGDDRNAAIPVAPRREMSAMIPMRRFRLLVLVLYLVVGLLVAAQKDYFADVTNLSGLLSLIVAVLLWPLVLLACT